MGSVTAMGGFREEESLQEAKGVGLGSLRLGENCRHSDTPQTPETIVEASDQSVSLHPGVKAAHGAQLALTVAHGQIEGVGQAEVRPPDSGVPPRPSTHSKEGHQASGRSPRAPAPRRSLGAGADHRAVLQTSALSGIQFVSWDMDADVSLSLGKQIKSQGLLGWPGRQGNPSPGSGTRKEPVRQMPEKDKAPRRRPGPEGPGE